MKKGKKRLKIPGAKTALAVATKLGLRKNKGLENIPPEAMITSEHRDQDTEDALLAAALKAMPPIDPATVEALKHIGDLRPGERRSASGAVIYPDSIVYPPPYVGSEAEERAGELLKGPIKHPPSHGKWPKTTCPTCLGHGYPDPVGRKRKCVVCKGKGWLPARRQDE
jgi:hypothetical protein